MPDTLYARPGAVIEHTGVDFTGAEGKLVKANAGALQLNDSATTPAVGVVLEGAAADQHSSIGVLPALGGAVRVKLGGSVAKFGQLQQAADGTVEADAGAGARAVVGLAMEAGDAGDLVLAYLHEPTVFTA